MASSSTYNTFFCFSDTTIYDDGCFVVVVLPSVFNLSAIRNKKWFVWQAHHYRDQSNYSQEKFSETLLFLLSSVLPRPLE